jgi:hypothetical protein
MLSNECGGKNSGTLRETVDEEKQRPQEKCVHQNALFLKNLYIKSYSSQMSPKLA